ncbi:MAG: LysR family transcriptional regulator [Gammaproteobacteria bacterium]|nr:LysR family transcriptional regulator [Gammaproteobacteria bacterium]
MSAVHLRRLDLNLLLTLHVLLEEGQVSRAARRLALTQSAVSHALQRLREHFDDPLLVRRGQSMTPTPRALELQGPLRQILASIEQMVGPAEFDPAGARGTLRIATTDYGLSVLLPHVLAALSEAAPQLSIAYTDIGEDAYEHLKTGFLDLALTGQETYRDMRTETLFTERFVVMTRPDHPVAGGGTLTVEDFIAWPHVLVDVLHSRLHGIDRELKRLGKSRQIALRVPRFLAAPFFAQSSNMIVPVPERLAQLYASSLKLAICEPPPELDIGRFDYVQMWHDRRTNDPLHRWLRALVRQAARGIREG